MTELRDEYPVESQVAGGAQEWVRPAVQRLAAGSAEDGSGLAADALNYS